MSDQNDIFIAWIKENIWSFLNEKQQLELNLVLDKQNFILLEDYSDEEESDSSWHDRFGYCSGWKWCKCSSCEVQRETEAYCELAEEYEEEMYDVIKRFLEKDLDENCSEENLICLAEEVEME